MNYQCALNPNGAFHSKNDTKIFETELFDYILRTLSNDIQENVEDFTTECRPPIAFADQIGWNLSLMSKNNFAPNVKDSMIEN